MKNILHTLIFTLIGNVAFSQATIDPKSISVPRYSNLAAIQSSLPTPQTGAIVYNNQTNTFFYYNGSAWTNITTSGGGGDSFWTQTGNFIKNTNSDGFWSEGQLNESSTVPVSGNGSRLMWLPKKGVFRAGTVGSSSKAWDSDSIGFYSIGLGYNTKAKGWASITMGANTTAGGEASTAMGSNTSAGSYSTAMGSNTSAGSHSTAMGANTSASFYSTAMGDNTMANGSYSTAMGRSTTANGPYSTVMGYNTRTYNSYSTAMGYNTEASGQATTAMGYNTIASGSYSTTMGLGTIANSWASLVIGYYNTPLDDPLFIIGNGNNNSNRSNAMIVTSNGRVGIGTNNPLAPLDINGFANSYSGDAFAYLGKGTTSFRLAQQNSGLNYPYSIRTTGVILASEIHLNSDARHKRIVSRSNPLEALSLLKQLQPTTYQFVDTIGKGNQEKLGFIAQEVQKVMPEAISLSSEIIPNVYALATKISHYGSTLRITTPKPHQFVVDDEIRLIVSAGEKQPKVTAIINETTFEVSGFEKPVETVFVFGKRVKDFHTVDYDRIFTLGISAIQQLATDVDLLKSQLLELDTLKKRLDSIEASLHSTPIGK